MPIISGNYAGDGSARSITGLGFQPVCVIIKARTGSREGQITISTMGADATKTISSNVSAGLTAGRITSLDSDGFSLGTDVTVNAASTNYDYLAFGAKSEETAVGTYTGNGSSQAITGLGFQPGAVIIASNDATTRVQWASSDMPTGHCSNFGAAGGVTNGTGVTSLDSGGFTVSSNAGINANTVTYYFIAIKTTPLVFKPLTYTGNTSDNRSITGAGFQPQNVITKNQGQTQAAAFRAKAASGDDSSQLHTGNNTTNLIQAFEADGFQVGTAAGVNSDTQTFYAMCFRDGTSITGGSGGGGGGRTKGGGGGGGGTGGGGKPPKGGGGGTPAPSVFVAGRSRRRSGVL
ncbi:MAG TPA: hypothetical protein VLA89_11830 [Gemmatimonadales bacterium]|nr:hypothetical protein [Gemmatimonadales bacterium]